MPIDCLFRKVTPCYPQKISLCTFISRNAYQKVDSLCVYSLNERVTDYQLEDLIWNFVSVISSEDHFPPSSCFTCVKSTDTGVHLICQTHLLHIPGKKHALWRHRTKDWLLSSVHLEATSREISHRLQNSWRETETVLGHPIAEGLSDWIKRILER